MAQGRTQKWHGWFLQRDRYRLSTGCVPSFLTTRCRGLRLENTQGSAERAKSGWAINACGKQKANFSGGGAGAGGKQSRNRRVPRGG